MRKSNKKSVRRMISFLCAICLLVSGEGSYCATALGAMLSERHAAVKVSADTNIDTAAGENGNPSAAIEAVDADKSSTEAYAEASAKAGARATGEGSGSHAVGRGAASTSLDADGALVDGIEFADTEGVSIAAADGSFLPEDASSHMEVLTGQAEENAVASIEEYLGIAGGTVEDVGDEAVAAAVNAEGVRGVQDDQDQLEAVTYDKTQYTVFDISLDNVDADAYEYGFWVEAVLPSDIVGRDYHLYHIHDGEVAEIEDVNVEDGILRFITPDFSQFVLEYTVDFHHGEGTFDFSIIGGNTISLKELAARLHLVDVADQAALDAVLESLHPEAEAEKAILDDADETEGVPDKADPASAKPAVWPKEIEEFVANIASVSWTNSDVATVTKIEKQTTVGDLVDSLGLVNQFSDEMTEAQIEAEMNLVLAAGDWAFISTQPFFTEETLAITMQNGDVYEIGVTDAAGYSNVTLRNPTVNIKTGDTITSHASNLNFALTNNGLARVTGKAVNNAGTYYYIPDKIEHPAGSGKFYQVNNISTLTPAAINGRCVVFDDDLCLHMLDAEQTSLTDIVDHILAEMMVSSGLANEEDVTEADYSSTVYNAEIGKSFPGLTDARVDELAMANGFVVGEKNESDGNLFELFKRAQYDVENNIVTIELKYFQKMKRNVPLDFIFVYDDSGTMASAATNHADKQHNADGVSPISYSASQSVWCRIALQVILKGIMDESSSNKDKYNQGYNIRMAPIAFASNAFYTPNTFYDNYVSAKEAIGKIYTSGGTEHYKALEDALDLARYSINHDQRNPIVVYLSDFHSNANSARAKTAAANLRALKNGDENVQVYTIHMFESNFRYDRNIATDKNHMYILNDTRPVSDLLTIFDTITKDAIGYYIGKGLSVQDGISGNLANLSTNITMSGDANSSKSGNNVNWTFSDDETRRQAGVIYSQTITVQMRDDEVFSPSMTSNSTCKVLNTTDDENGNDITTEVNKITDQPKPKDELRMILGLLDENGGKTNTVITGAGFELYRGNSATGTPVWTGTTAEVSTTGGTNVGEIAIPYSAAPFAAGETYTLKQISTNEDIAVMPVPGTWTLTVGSDYQINSSNGGEPETPAMTVSNGEFHIWNNSKANTMTVLVPVVIKKVWDGYEPQSGDSISFTVLGNDGSGGTVELPAYKNNNRTADDFDELDTVTTLSASDRDINNTPWTKIVYVPATSGEGAAKLTFFDTAQGRYTNGYTVREDGITVSAPNGDWEETIDSTGTVPGENYTYYTYEGQEGWQTVSISSNCNPYHLRINKNKYHSELAVVTKINLTFTYNITNDSIKKTAKMDLGVPERKQNDYSSNAGDEYVYQIKIPQNWENLTITDLHFNDNYDKSYEFYTNSSTAGDFAQVHFLYDLASGNYNITSESLLTESHVEAIPHTATSLAKEILQITNTFTPMYTINFGTQWVDESGDSASTLNAIDAVTYTVLNSDGTFFGEPITVEKGDTLNYPDTPASIRVPAGTYTIRQGSYTLANGMVISTVAPTAGEANTYQFAAYTVTNNKDSSSGGTYTMTVGEGTTSPVEVKFTNTRKQFTTTVRTQWLPEGHTLQYNGDIPYELSYTTFRSDNMLEARTVPGTNAASAWSAQHEHIPSHGVNGQSTVCNIKPETVEALAAKYNTRIESKIENGNYIFTIINTLRQGDIILHKDWEYAHNETEVKVLVQGYGLTQEAGYTLSENYEAFSTGEDGGIIVTLNEENGWMHILKGYKDYKYTVEEIDPYGDIAQYVVRRYWMSGDDQDTAASFTSPTITGTYTDTGTNVYSSDSGLQEAGVEVFITNFQPICKIVDANGEHPFRLLNSAVKYSRENLSGTAKIEMLVDYEIPASDKVVLGGDTDNITITTAATSGGVYNFKKTFGSTEGRTTTDSEATAILSRKSDFTNDSLFQIYNASAKLTTTKIIFDGRGISTAASGGIVHVEIGKLYAGSDTVMRNSVVNATGNSYGTQTGNGGAIFLSANGAEAVENGLLIDGHSDNVIGSDDEQNKTDAKNAAANAVNGGGIYVSSGASFTFTGGELTKCKASANGGAIFNHGTLIMDENEESGDAHNLLNGSLEYCSAKNGGAIYNAASIDGRTGGIVDMTGGYIEHCFATDNGGGIYTASTEKQTVNGKEVGAVNLHTENQKPGIIKDCSAANGGGIYLAAGGLDMAGGTIEGCTAERKSGDAYEQRRKVGDAFGSNGTGEILRCASGNGGGIYVKDSVLKLSQTTNATGDLVKNIKSCVAQVNGGGIFIDGTGHVEITGGTIQDCRAVNFGGAIYDHATDDNGSTYELSATNLIIRGHTAGNLPESTANAQKGGGIYMCDGKMQLDNCQIYDCTSSQQGGAIYQIYDRVVNGATKDTGGKKLTLTDVTIDGHKDLTGSVPNAQDGGAIYIFNGINLQNPADSGWKDYKDDAVSWTDLSKKAGPQLEISGGSILDCTATSRGGAVYCDSPASTGKPTMYIHNGTVINGHETLSADIANAQGELTNVAENNRGGGAIYYNRGTLRIEGTESSNVVIKNCTTAYYGGAIYGLPEGSFVDNVFNDEAGISEKARYTALLKNVTFDGHDGLNAVKANAGKGGGGICMKMGILYIENCTFQNLRAPEGAAIYGRTNDGGTSAATITIKGGSIKDNISTNSNGGAINVPGGAKFKNASNATAQVRIGFGGDVRVIGNTCTEDPIYERNVVLEMDSNVVIHSLSDGLTETARVGIFVVDETKLASNTVIKPYDTHGKPGEPFGTWGLKVDTSSSNKPLFSVNQGTGGQNLFHFVNDRNGCWGETRGDDGLIYWTDPIVKVTDKDNKLLYALKEGIYYPAVFEKLTEAVEAAEGTLYYRVEGSNLYAPSFEADAEGMTATNLRKLKMVKDYVMPGADNVTLNNAIDNLVLTTAETDANTSPMPANKDIFTFTPAAGATGENLTKATITRGANGVDSDNNPIPDASMIAVGNAETAATLNTVKLILTDIILDGAKGSYQPKVNGGIVNVAAGTLGVTTGAKLQNSKVGVDGNATEGSTGLGGAVYVAPNATMNLDAATISGNEVAQTGNGAGIYLPEGSTLNISGSPSFTDNFKDPDTAWTGKTNGGEEYVKPKQDIFIAGYIGTDNSTGDPVNATSLKVTGELSNVNGANDMSIWVWADENTTDTENNHFKQLKQFAVFDLPSGTTLSDEQKASTMKVFRNAVPDDQTEGSEALYGQFSDDDSTDPKVYIYWSGVAGYRKVILRKVDGSSYASLAGATFNLYRGSSNNIYLWKDPDDKTKTFVMGKEGDKENLTSLSSGVLWVGELPYGTYFLKETKAPDNTAYSGNVNKWFCLIIDETGVYMSAGFKESTEAASRTKAENAAKALMPTTTP